MKLTYDTGMKRHSRTVESLTITGQIIVSGDQIIAEIGMDKGQICWLDPVTKTPLAWLEVVES